MKISAFAIAIVLVIKGSFGFFDSKSAEVKASAESRLAKIEEVSK